MGDLRRMTLRVLVTNGATRLSRVIAGALSGEHDVRLTGRAPLADVPAGVEVVRSDLGHGEATNDLVRGMDGRRPLRRARP